VKLFAHFLIKIPTSVHNFCFKGFIHRRLYIYHLEMLPSYQYKHYYDELCQFCEDVMVTQDERCEEGGECKECNRVICEGCREDKLCEECEEAICDSCNGSCKFCPDSRFCEDCLDEHKQSCTRVRRAERKLDKLNGLVDSLELRLEEVREELEEANKQQQIAEQNWAKVAGCVHSGWQRP